MTLTLDLSPEKETALKAKARARGVSAEQYALQVIDRDLDSPDRPRRHISEVIREIMSDVPPPEDFAKLPEDGASEHDHYIYGTPKRKQ